MRTILHESKVRRNVLKYQGVCNSRRVDRNQVCYSQLLSDPSDDSRTYLLHFDHGLLLSFLDLNERLW